MAAAEMKIDPTAFKPISDPTERSLILRAIAQIGGQLQIKVQDAKGVPTGDIAHIRAEKVFNENSLLATHLSGPTIDKSEASVVFEVSKSLFFCLAKVLSVGAGQYSLEIGNLYSLQRRDTFRVPINASVVKAVFKVNAVAGRGVPVDLPLVDLSEGGMGLVLEDGQEEIFKQNILCSGVLSINKHPGLSVTLQIRYVRKMQIGSNLFTQAGGSFQNMNASSSQKMAALVNECHRLIFSKFISERK